MKSKLRLLTVSLLGLALLGSACEDSNPLAAFEPEIITTADAFQFQATGVKDVSTTLSYSWANPAAQATVNHASTVTGGSAAMVVLDAAGTQVYSHPLVASATETTAAGTAGTWTVRVSLSQCDGTLNFRVERQ